MKYGTTLLLILVFAASGFSAETRLSLKQTSKNGLRGWTIATRKNYQGAWMNDRLIVIGKDKKKTEFMADFAFIDRWGFVDYDSAIVLRSIGAHGPYHWQKFSLASGELIDGYFRGKDSDPTPSWVKPFLDEN